jgi:dCMP deaminase
METGPREDYLSWDDYFMSIAKLSALRSKDPNRQVGCCIVEPDSKKIVSIGYNGFPRGCSDSDLPWGKNGNWVDTKYPYVVHAEANAIVNSSSSLKGCSLYVTLFPCNECAKLMIQSGIKKVFYENDTSTESKQASVKMFDLTNTIVKQQKNKTDICLKCL